MKGDERVWRALFFVFKKKTQFMFYRLKFSIFQPFGSGANEIAEIDLFWRRFKAFTKRHPLYVNFVPCRLYTP